MNHPKVSALAATPPVGKPMTKKQEREYVRLRFGGNCAYCGHQLGDRWHRDHIEPVGREHKWVRGKGFVPTGEMSRPDLDTVENSFPACVPCNLDKSGHSLQQWRLKLQRSSEILARDASAYRHAVRFGLVVETPKPVVFFFERWGAQEGAGRAEEIRRAEAVMQAELAGFIKVFGHSIDGLERSAAQMVASTAAEKIQDT